MPNRKTPRLSFTFMGVFTLMALLLAPSNVFALTRINSTPSSATVAEGSSTTVSIALDEPIICSDPHAVCNVVLNFTSTDPSVTVSPNPLTFGASQWFSPQTLTISAANDGLATGDKNVTLSTTAVSASEYYSNFKINIPVTVTNDIGLPPAPGVTDKMVVVASNDSVVVDVLTGVSGAPDPATLAIISGPSHGTAVDPPSTITYTPNKGYVGSDSLTYRVCSSINTTVCSTATLNFNVTAGGPDTGFGSPVQPNRLPVYAALLSCTTLLAGLLLAKKHGLKGTKQSD